MWTNGIRPVLGDAGRGALEPLAPWALERRWRRYAEETLPSWVAPDPSLRHELQERVIEASRAPRPKNRYEAAMRLALDHPLVAMEFEEQFVSGREMGIPVRQPYFDADLIELLSRLPPEALFSGGRDKGLARAMVAERFPELGFPRKRKVVATSFCRAVFADEIPALWKSLTSARALDSLGVVDAKLLDEEVRLGFASRDRGLYAVRLWGALSVETWLRSRV